MLSSFLIYGGPLIIVLILLLRIRSYLRKIAARPAPLEQGPCEGPYRTPGVRHEPPPRLVEDERCDSCDRGDCDKNHVFDRLLYRVMRDGLNELGRARPDLDETQRHMVVVHRIETVVASIKK